MKSPAASSSSLSNMATRSREIPDHWSFLPSDLLVSIAEKLFVADIIRLRVVCTAWAWSFGRPRNGWPAPPRHRASFVPIPPSVPWMLLPNKNGEEADFCSFLDLSDGQIRRISHVPQMVGRRCVGASPDGWLVTLDLELNPRLLNPLTREEVPLPSLVTLLPYPANASILRGGFHGYEEADIRGRRSIGHDQTLFRDSFFSKIVLTSAPPSGVAVVFFGSEDTSTKLAFARTGDSSWIHVSLSKEPVRDVTYDRESCRLYVLTSSDSFIYYDLRISDWPSGLQMSPDPLPMIPKSVAIQERTAYALSRRRSNLIFLSGHLLKISRYVKLFTKWENNRRLGRPLGDHEEDEAWEEEDWGDEDGEEEHYEFPSLEDYEYVVAETGHVDITKFDSQMKRPSWIPANPSDLDGQAVFVGCNHVFSLPAAGKPGLRKNSVYFTETTTYDSLQWRRHTRDAGVFDAETGAFQRFFSSDSRVNWPPPVWFMPSKLHFEPL